MKPVSQGQPAAPQTAKKADKQDATAQQVLQTGADQLNTSTTVLGFAQDSVRTSSLIYKGANSGARGLRLAAALLNADQGTLETALDKTRAGLTRLAGKASPAAAARLDKAASPTLRGAGTAFRAISKASSIIGIPFAGMDVYHAVKAKGQAKNGAIANAVFSVAGTIAGIAGACMLSTPFALPLLATSAGTVGVQLLDTYATNGKIMDFLGQHVVAPLRKLF